MVLVMIHVRDGRWCNKWICRYSMQRSQEEVAVWRGEGNKFKAAERETEAELHSSSGGVEKV